MPPKCPHIACSTWPGNTRRSRTNRYPCSSVDCRGQGVTGSRPVRPGAGEQCASWRTWPQRKLRRKTPRVDGAWTVQPSTLAVPPARKASASAMQSPPPSAEATRVSSLSPAFARPGASPRSRWAPAKFAEAEPARERGGEQQARLVHEAVVVAGDAVSGRGRSLVASNGVRQANWCLGRRCKSSTAKEQATPRSSASRARLVARRAVKRRQRGRWAELLSTEKMHSLECRGFPIGRRQHRRRRFWRAVVGLCGVKELTHACTSSTGTWEGSALSLRVATPGPQRKGRSRNPLTHEVEQSDPAIVVMRAANKEE